jgi:rod shape-determining protein MreD
MNQAPQNGWAIVATFVLSFMLAIIPLPSWAIPWRPEWATLVLIYWCMALPQRVGVVSGWGVGLIQDVLTGTLLGQQALSLAITAYFISQIHRRLRIYPIYQQMAIIFFVILISELPTLWVRGLQGHPPQDFEFMYSSFTSLLLWPWVFTGLRMWRRNLQIS